MKLKVVLHEDYGGFHLIQEIVNRMNYKGFDFSKFKLELYGSDDIIYFKDMDTFEFQSNPIFVATIKDLQEEKKSLEWIDYRREYISKLKIHEVDLRFEVVNYYDGRERLELNGHEVY